MFFQKKLTNKTNLKNKKKKLFFQKKQVLFFKKGGKQNFLFPKNKYFSQEKKTAKMSIFENELVLVFPSNKHYFADSPSSHVGLFFLFFGSI